MKKFIFVLIFLTFILFGCSEGGLVADHSYNQLKEVRGESRVYEVKEVDWLFGNWMKMCSSDRECQKVNLHDTDLRNDIDEGRIVKATEVNYQKGNNSWKEYEYEYID